MEILLYWIIVEIIRIIIVGSEIELSFIYFFKF